VLGRELERRRGLPWREPMRWVRRQWRRRRARARLWTQSRVRCYRLLQIGGHATRAEREMGGGGVARCRAEERKWKREGGGRARHNSVDRGVGGGNACSWWRRAGGQGRAVGRGRRGTTRLTGGAVRQRGPVPAAACGRERGK
jgi:hypothetical protein